MKKDYCQSSPPFSPLPPPFSPPPPSPPTSPPPLQIREWGPLVIYSI
jgi:hypothetical protein